MYLSLHICLSRSLEATAVFIFLAWVLRILALRQRRNHSAPPFYEVYQTAKYPVSLSNGSGANVPTEPLLPRRPGACECSHTPSPRGPLQSAACRLRLPGPPEADEGFEDSESETQPHIVHTCTHYVHTPAAGPRLPRQTDEPAPTPAARQPPGCRRALRAGAASKVITVITIPELGTFVERDTSVQLRAWALPSRLKGPRVFRSPFSALRVDSDGHSPALCHCSPLPASILPASQEPWQPQGWALYLQPHLKALSQGQGAAHTL